MQAENCTAISELVIVGFQYLHNYKKILVFCVLLLCYLVTCLENVLIIALVAVSSCLQTPMYILIGVLSCCEILYITNFIPRMLHDIITDRGTISVLGCITQLNVFATLGAVECLLFALMSYDRCLAIYKPLRYSALINNRLCLRLSFVFLLTSFGLVLIISVSLGRLQLCGANSINHFYCDIGPLMSLSYSDTQLIQLMAALISALLTLLPFLVIVISYMCILCTIMKIQSSKGRKKAFSTCSSHLLVVTIYYGTLISIYVIPARPNSIHINKGLSFVYIVVTPLKNPVIYTLRNRDIHTALEAKIVEFKRHFFL